MSSNWDDSSYSGMDVFKFTDKGILLKGMIGEVPLTSYF